MDEPVEVARPPSEDREALARLVERVDKLESRVSWWESFWKRIIGQVESLYHAKDERLRK